MKTNKILLTIILLAATLCGRAQSPVYKLVADASGTAGKDFLVTIEWPASSSYTNVTLDNAFIGVLYTEGTTLTRSNVSGSWTNSTSLTKATINAVCGSALNSDDFNFQFYNLPVQHQFGNRTTGGADTLFKLQSSTFLSTGKIQLITNTSPSASVDSCLYHYGAKNTGTIDPAYPSLSTGFDIVGTGGSLALPIEMLDFSGKWRGDDAQVNWSTAMEKDNSGFLIERSFDGSNFEVVSSFIQSKGTNGNSNGLLNYQWYDYSVRAQVSSAVYYRIRQIDFNGQSETFGPIALNNRKHDELISVYPNPSSKDVYVRFEGSADGSEEVHLLDMTGRKITVLSERNSNGLWKLSVDHLDRGFYQVRMIQGSREYTRKIVVK